MHSDLSMQKEFDIKWKSRDISGSASLALWANMNQSTTQLGSKRQSQGKNPYQTIDIFICCCAVIICPVSIYILCEFFFPPFLWFLHKFLFCLLLVCSMFFFNCSFSPRWFSCLQPSCPPIVTLFEVFVMLKFTVCPLFLRTYIWSLSEYSLAWTF